MSLAAPFDAEEPDVVEPPGCDVTFLEDGAVAKLHGDLDLASAPEVQRQLLATLTLPVAALTVDLEQVTFMDSSGIRVLLLTRDKAAELGLDFRLESVPSQARQVIDICGLSERFGVQ
jgi:anti-sigma B factor antagonist